MNPEGKRRAIMEAGEQLFAQRGFGNTSIADIARAAKVAVGSVYRLFPDKSSLLAALHRRMEQRFVDVMTEAWRSVDAYPAKFNPLIGALLGQAEAVRDIMPLYVMTKDMVGCDSYVPGENMIEAIEALYAEGVAAGAYRPVRPGVLGPLAHGMVEGAMRAWMMRPTRRNRDQVQAELLKVFERAFLTERKR